LSAKVAGADGTQRAQHLELFVAHGAGLEGRWRLHGDQAEKLQHVVLHHVAQGPGMVVIAAPALDTQFLGDGDLHVVDQAGVPHGFQERVGEAERHQVLHRFLAEIVVDAEHLTFFERLAHRRVDRLGRG